MSSKLESNNLYYINVSHDLISEYLDMMNSKDINKFLSFKDRLFTLEDESKWIDQRLLNNDIIFSIIEKNTNKFVGNISVMSSYDKEAEIGIVIKEGMQNKHYGSESIRWFINYLINVLKFEDIILSVYSHNLKAIHCYESLGFVEYKRDIDVGSYNGKSCDDIYMRLDRK